jgi:hypothetical protein
MKTISAKRLDAAGACSDQVRLFRDTFGDKPVKINAENWAKAGEVGLDRFWLEGFLKGPARAEYKRVRDAAWAEYKRVRDAALAEYERVCGPALAEYKRVAGAALFEALTK